MIRPATACQEETKFCNVDSRLHIVGAECTFSPIVVFIIMLSHLKLHAAVGRTKQAPFPTIFPFMCLSQEAPIFHKTITSLSSASNTILVMTPGSRFRSYLDVNHVLPRRAKLPLTVECIRQVLTTSSSARGSGMAYGGPCTVK